jgi:hypothetical protein
MAATAEKQLSEVLKGLKKGEAGGSVPSHAHGAKLTREDSVGKARHAGLSNMH